jgi:hypothetical protein
VELIPKLILMDERAIEAAVQGMIVTQVFRDLRFPARRGTS